MIPRKCSLGRVRYSSEDLAKRCLYALRQRRPKEFDSDKIRVEYCRQCTGWHFRKTTHV